MGLKNDIKLKTVKLNTTNNKGKKDKTAVVRQRFMDMIIRNDRVAPQARRYTLEDKMFCISIYKRSPSTYKFLSKYLFCPFSSILNKQLQQIPFDTGCNKIIIQYLKLLATEIDPQDLTCILIWDEISIQPAMHYDKKTDKIIDFEDWGNRRTRKFADHCIVFYMRCLASGNHMPIGYGYCRASTYSMQLSKYIKEWLTILIQCGFKPVATVCDQGGTNIAAINSLIKDTQLCGIKKIRQ
ncbi:uncharacterized protein [Linepithema humile]|uniref:uncharacterized protein n=1 Tax=Linepithema humile TaxID=83485 RepID=UPI00351E7693